MSIPMLDPAAVDRLRRIGGDKLLRAMLGSFLDNAAARMSAAAAAVAAGDGQGLADAAHALKSSAGNIGATTLQLTAQKVEREAVEEGANLELLLDELRSAHVDASTAATRERGEIAG